MRHPAAALALFAALALGPSMALADAPPAPAPSVRSPDEATAEARALYTQGIDLAKRSQWAEALALFERSSTLRPHPVTTYNVGVCEWSLGRYVRARRSLGRALARATPEAELPAAMAKEAEAYVGEIERILVHLSVDLQPADAGIAVDGRPIELEGRVLFAGLREPGAGEAPPTRAFELVVDPGTRTFTLSRKGFANIVLNRTFAPGTRAPLTLELARLPGTLRIASTESAAAVTVNGIDVGLAPLDLSRPSGAYRVLLRKEGFDPYEARVTLNAGEETRIQAALVATETPITKKWWFWTGAATIIAGGVLLTYAVTRPEAQPPPYERGSTGWLVEPASR